MVPSDLQPNPSLTQLCPSSSPAQGESLMPYPSAEKHKGILSHNLGTTFWFLHSRHRTAETGNTLGHHLATLLLKAESI